MARRVLARECPPRAEHVTSSGWRPQRHPVMTTTGDVLEHGLKDRQHRMAADLQYSRLSLTCVLPFLYKKVYFI